MPPALAATEGMAGASKASANTSEYVKPKVVFPKSETMPYAMREPSPDLMKPPDRKNAIAISHLHRHTSLNVADWFCTHALGFLSQLYRVFLCFEQQRWDQDCELR